jgi:hypothetical protein
MLLDMEKTPPQPDPNSKFFEVKKKAAEIRAKKKMTRDEANQRAEQISRESDENDEP